MDCRKRKRDRRANGSVYSAHGAPVVTTSKKNELCLYLLARREQWNKADKRGARPFNCKICEIDEGYAEMHGCIKKREGGPRPIGPYKLDRCPNYYLKQPDALRDEVVSVYQDYRAGTVKGWPDAYSGAVAQGVRLVDREINTCDAELLRERQLESERHSGRQ